MKIEEIKQFLNNQLLTLEMDKNQAFLTGNIVTYAEIEKKIIETTNTLNILNNI
jgi:hypothetical protein